MRRPVLAVLAVLVTLGAASEAVAAPPAVVSVGADPARVAPGGTLTAGGKVANGGDRARLVRVRLELRRGADRVVIGSTRVRVGAHTKRRYRITATVPGSTADGAYAVAACVGRACRTAAGRLTVARPPAPPAPSPGGGGEPVPAPVPPPAPAPPAPGPFFSPGARSGGDILFPQIGNGGYDARHYDLDLAYEPSTQVLTGQASMHAVATQDLSRFSMDFQGMTVQRVRINGHDVTFTREVPGQASANAEGIASKLVITPVSGILAGSPFTVTVDYAGRPDTVTDPDGSSEGWFYTATGGAVVCQPIGCQAVYPQNNIPWDKATFSSAITVPAGLSGIGNGVLVGRSTAGGRTTWRWRMDQPISTYLTTATVGDYELRERTDALGREVHDFIDRAPNDLTTPPSPVFTPAEHAIIDTRLADQSGIVDFLSGVYGPYPFDAYGSIIANAGNVGYALEVATKPFYPGAFISSTTWTHELAHQWFGDSLTYRQIQDMWIQEGMAQWMEWHWYAQERGGPSTQDEFDALYADPTTQWSLPPALPAADQIFDAQVYERGAMTWDGLRQITGDTAFFAFVAELADRFRYGSITTEQFMAVAEEVLGRDLDAYFRDWLYTPGRPPLPSTY